jgi:hypothetical protein
MLLQQNLLFPLLSFTNVQNCAGLLSDDEDEEAGGAGSPERAKSGGEAEDLAPGSGGGVSRLKRRRVEEAPGAEGTDPKAGYNGCSFPRASTRRSMTISCSRDDDKRFTSWIDAKSNAGCGVSVIVNIGWSKVGSERRWS